jgi:hypothetical protein
MAKTKGLRKAKYRKRHSRKKYGGGEEEEEETLTKPEARNRMKEINVAIKNMEDKEEFNKEKLAYLNRYIDIQNISFFTTGEKGKTKQKEILDNNYEKASGKLKQFIAIVKSGLLKQNDLNESKEKIESTLRELEKLKKEKNELEKKFKKNEWACPESLEMSYTINGSKQMGEYKGVTKRTTGEYGKCVPNGQGTWKSNIGENTIEGKWDMGKFVDEKEVGEKEGGKKKRSKKTQRKRKRKHRVSSRH